MSMFIKFVTITVPLKYFVLSYFIKLNGQYSIRKNKIIFSMKAFEIKSFYNEFELKTVIYINWYE